MSLFFIVLVVEMLIAGVLMSMIGIDDSAHKMGELLDQMSFWIIFLLAVIIAPVTEEIIFRYYITHSTTAVFFLLWALVFGIAMLMFNQILEEWVAIPLILIPIALMVTVLNSKKLQDRIKAVYNQGFPYVFYLSAVIFAYVHIFNFEDVFPWYYAPILVFPQFFLGLYLGYIRTRNGLPHAILLHATNNLIPMIILGIESVVNQ